MCHYLVKESSCGTYQTCSSASSPLERAHSVQRRPQAAFRLPVRARPLQEEPFSAWQSSICFKHGAWHCRCERRSECSSAVCNRTKNDWNQRRHPVGCVRAFMTRSKQLCSDAPTATRWLHHAFYCRLGSTLPAFSCHEGLPPACPPKNPRALSSCKFGTFACTPFHPVADGANQCLPLLVKEGRRRESSI